LKHRHWQEIQVSELARFLTEEEQTTAAALLLVERLLSIQRDLDERRLSPSESP
jgi:hypothetical protein